MTLLAACTNFPLLGLSVTHSVSAVSVSKPGKHDYKHTHVHTQLGVTALHFRLGSCGLVGVGLQSMTLKEME